MRSVVSNTSPLQYLHQAELLHLLPVLFGRVQTPRAVATELDEGRNRGVDVPDLAGLDWITVRPVRDVTLLPSAGNLGAGEKEVIALGREGDDSLVILDDRDARRNAAMFGLEVTGTLGILLLAKKRGMLDALRPVLDGLQDLGFWLRADTRKAVLRLADE